MKSIKSFFVFFCAFLGLICAIAIPVLIFEKNYKNLLILFCVLSMLLGIAIPLYAFFISMATDFHTCGNDILLKYTSSSKKIQISDVERIIVTDYRYVLCLKSGKKNYITRIIAPLELQKRIDPKIINLSIEHAITLEKK